MAALDDRAPPDQRVMPRYRRLAHRSTHPGSTDPPLLNVWPYLAGQADLNALLPTTAEDASRRLTRFVRPHLIQHLTPRLLADADTTTWTLQSRYLRGAYRALLHDWAAAGIDAVAIKGYAHAFTLYPQPDLRVMADLDVVIAPADVPKAVDRLKRQGLDVAGNTLPRRRGIAHGIWKPMTDAAGDLNIDIHVEPDIYPLTRALDRQRLLAEAVWSDAAASYLPRREHAALISISHLAKDLFGASAIKRLIDLIRLLPSGPYPADWAEVWQLARRAHLGKPTAVTLALVERLGVNLGPLPDKPAQAVQRAHRTPRLGRLAGRWTTLFPDDGAGPGGKVLAELLFACEFPTLVHRYSRRLTSLVRPRDALPPGSPTGRGC